MTAPRTTVSQVSKLLAVISSAVLVAHFSTTHAAPRKDALLLPAQPEATAAHPEEEHVHEETPESAAALEKALALGTRQTANVLLTRAPSRELRDAAEGHGAKRLLWPIDGGNFVRGFGFVRKERKHLPHLGVDIAAPIGTPIHAAADGIVGYADDGVKGYGNLAIVVHADGAVTSYAHCDKLLVTPGQRVQRGEVIALVGSTGISKGPHLHFEYRKGGKPKNPMAKFDRPRRDEGHGRPLPVASLDRRSSR